MKILKNSMLVILSLLVLSCSKNDDDSGGDGPAEFTATINGGTYNNYTATLGSFSVSTDNGLTIAVVDENGNTIRLFMNSTNGFGSGTTKAIGNMDSNGFTTSALFRDQSTQIIYNATSGNIRITENNESDENGNRILSGNFDVTSASSGEQVTMTGTFRNIPVFGL